MKRGFDLVISLVALTILLPVIFLIGVAVNLTSNGHIFFYADRIGRNNRRFKMLKFRSMRIDTPVVATHLLPDPANYLTPIGNFLRKTSLDELPQFWNVLQGNMSLVGPRPALFNQDDLVNLRTQRGLHLLLPGITGWAQVNGRDGLPIPEKVDLDAYYLQNQSLMLDLQILWMTMIKVFQREGVSH